ncbi:MAG: phosphate ABC transporter substrate-binding protein [Selenomonadaceae bacterium]|nr:phosphate ABC transporter substrate-binding protein [Selenomonadaceae bacterium]MDD6396904.1 phosphate ABC transporter substrate-binding protein [Selenomonadaceae bacterium]
MKKLFVGFMCVCVMMLGMLAAGCGNNSSKGGSGMQGAVSTNGSTSMEKVIGILSEAFMEDNPGVTITYDASGSGTGIEAVSKGNTDIGLASRALKKSEKEKGLVEKTVAFDGIALIVNEKAPLNDLTTAQVAGLFTGDISDWSAIGGKAGAVAAIGREAGSGTRDGFESITKTKDKCKLAQELTSTGAVIEAVKNSEAAIGYASYASVVNQPGIKILKINGVACSNENIANGSYVIQRPFNLITKEGQQLSEAAQAFYNFMISEAAHELILRVGAVPVK